jgi:hypothetical protein
MARPEMARAEAPPFSLFAPVRSVFLESVKPAQSLSRGPWLRNSAFVNFVCFCLIRAS